MTPQQAKQLLKDALGDDGELDNRYEKAKPWIYEQIKQGALGGSNQIHIDVYSRPFSNTLSLSSFGVLNGLGVAHVADRLRSEGYDVAYPNMSITPSIIINL
jgi:hypothetical protein